MQSSKRKKKRSEEEEYELKRLTERQNGEKSDEEGE